MISIIIPTFNEEKVIEGTLARLRHGEIPHPYELIVADDGSTDRTVQLARRHADRVAVRSPHTPHTTIAANRNRGAAAARGEFLVFIDAGVEVPQPGRFLQSLLDDFARDPGLAAEAVGLRVFPQEATAADRLIFAAVNFLFWLTNNVLRIGSTSGKFQIIRTAAFRRAGGYAEQLAVTEDNELFMRLAKIGRTRMRRDLTVFFSGRRAHAIGWPRLLAQWTANWLSMVLRKRSISKTWEAIR